MAITSAGAWWLAVCLIIVFVLTLTAVVAFRRRERALHCSPPEATLPDFAVLDRGGEIHFVPTREQGHLLSLGECTCGSRRTSNRRRSGARVTYVDHRPLRRARPFAARDH